MGDVEYGKCDICLEMDNLSRRYYYFPIPCECCSNQHFEIVRHCKNCKPEQPAYTKPMLRTKSEWMKSQGKWHKKINWPSVIAYTLVTAMAITMLIIGYNLVISIINQL